MRTLIGLTLLILLTLAACSDGDDSDTPTPPSTRPPATASGDETAEEPATAIPGAAEATPTPASTAALTTPRPTPGEAPTAIPLQQEGVTIETNLPRLVESNEDDFNLFLDEIIAPGDRAANAYYQIDFEVTPGVVREQCIGRGIRAARLASTLTVTITNLETGEDVASREWVTNNPPPCPAQITEEDSERSIIGHPDSAEVLEWLSENIPEEHLP